MSNQWVSPYGNRWKVQREGAERATKLFDTQRAAIDYAREIARNQQSELIIQRPNGQIRDKDSYGNDPFPPRDTKH